MSTDGVALASEVCQWRRGHWQTSLASATHTFPPEHSASPLCEGAQLARQREVDVFFRRANDLRESLLQAGDDSIGVVNRKRRLRKISQFGAGRESQAIHIFRRFDEHKRIGRLAHRADYFVVAGMPDEQNRVTLF